MSANRLDRETLQRIAQLLEADTDDFNTLVRLTGLDPARDFRHADLSGTSMVGADLRGFDFSHTNFCNVDLEGALIAGVLFNGADLNGTDLSRAKGAEAADCSFAVFQDKPFAPEMVNLPEGQFLFNLPDVDKLDSEDEMQKIMVNVKAFAIGRYPVTFDQYDYYCELIGIEKPRDEGWGRGRRPVINISWNDAREYAAWLVEMTNIAYWIPTEEEWEYACRAGTTTAFWWGDEFNPNMANTEECGHGRTTEVGTFPQNPWGIFDAWGNIWELLEFKWLNGDANEPEVSEMGLGIADEPETSYVLRGGSWREYRMNPNAAQRFKNAPWVKSNYAGFRVACFSLCSGNRRIA